MVKTAIIGASGYIGQHLLRKYREKYPNSTGTSFSNNAKDLDYFDIRYSNIECLNLEQRGYKDILIASAISNIKYCGEEPEKTYDVNVTGTLKLIKDISKTSLKIIYLSSDAVFDGIKGCFGDYDATNPSTVYGKHKTIIEKEIIKITKSFLVLRLSKIYGLKKGDNTILDEAANKICNNEQVLSAWDQYLCPTYINDLTRIIINLQKKILLGT